MDKTALITFTAAMFTILNPIGNVAIFAGMVADRSAADRRSTAIRCAIAVAAILVATVWVGEMALSSFGVEIPSLQVAGGLMIASIALSMLHSKQSAIHDTKKAEGPPAPEQDIAVVPLANPPIVAGVTATFLVYVVAFSAILSGVLEMVAAIQDRKQIEGEGWLILGGAITVLFGVVLLISPLSFGLFMVRVLGAFAIFSGVSLIVFAFRLRRLGTKLKA